MPDRRVTERDLPGGARLLDRWSDEHRAAVPFGADADVDLLGFGTAVLFEVRLARQLNGR